jgi:transcriptional regulator with XRE-family HTH domain
MRTLTHQIRLLRNKRGWSQEVIAKLLDISIPAYSKIEAGITDINLSRLEQIAAVFNLSAAQPMAYGQNDNSGKTETLALANTKLAEREREMVELQNKVIELYEALKLQQVGS